MPASQQTAPRDSREAQLRASNRRLGLVLFSVVAAFFIGIILRYWLAR
jgi:hypothetical protein